MTKLARLILGIGIGIVLVAACGCDRGGLNNPFQARGRLPFTARGGLDLQSIEGGNVLRITPAETLGCTEFGLSPNAVVATYGVAAAAFTNGDTTSADTWWNLVGTSPLHTSGKLVKTVRCTPGSIVIGSEQGVEWVSTLDLTSGSFSTPVLNGNGVTALLQLDATHILAGVQNTNGAIATAVMGCDIPALECTQAAAGFTSFGGGDFVANFYRFPGGTILAGLNASGVFRSTDGGHTFAAANSGFTNGTFGAKSFVASGSDVFVSAAGGIYKSTNDGQTWTKMATGLGTGTIFPSAFSGTASALYASINSTIDGTPATLWKSTNGAASWQQTGTGMTAQSVNDLTVTSSALWAATNAGTFRSTDAGATWTPFNRGLENTGVYRVVSTGATLLAATYNNTNGVFRSLDGGRTWIPADTSMANRRIRSLAVVGSNVVAGGESGTFRSTDGGATFVAATGLPAGKNVYASATSGSTIFAGLYPTGFARSADGGASWTPGASPGGGVFMSAIATNGTAVVVAGPQIVYRSTDSGASWTGGAAIVPGDPNYTIYSLSFAGGALWAGLSGFGTPDTHGLVKSVDLGATWTRAQTGIPTNVDVYDVQTAGGQLLAGTGKGLFSSTNGGATWTPLYPDLSSTSVISIASSGGTYFLGTFGRGLFTIAEPAVARRLLPIVLDVNTGSAHYTTEAALTNVGITTTSVTLLYTASLGAGTGTVTESLAPGKQLVVPDVISYLRGKGLAIPTSGSQLGTLLATFSNLSDEQAAFVTGRTTTATASPQPVGAAGLAYASVDPVRGSQGLLRVYGIRETASDRSNVAIYNSSDVPVTVKVTAYSGAGDGANTVIEAAAVLPPWGWKQYDRILQGPGYSNGWVLAERVSASGAFGAYGVINDNVTNDGSFIPATAADVPPAFMDVPVLVETPTFRSELVLTNASTNPATFTLTFTESLAAGVTGNARESLLLPPAFVKVVLPPRTVQIHPEAVDWLRGLGATVGPRNGGSYAGSLHITVTGTSILDTNAGSRSAAMSPSGGQFGFYSPAHLPGEEAFDAGGIYGLRADENNRTNLAVMNRAASSAGGSITVRASAYDGDAGGNTVVGSRDFTLGPGQWAQANDILATYGIRNGYFKFQLISGGAPWDSYAIINDGRSPGQRTGDSVFLPITTRYSY